MAAETCRPSRSEDHASRAEFFHRSAANVANGNGRAIRKRNIDIDNPLRAVDDLDASVTQFAQDSGLNEIADLLARGARVAEDPDNFEAVDGLSERDKSALRQETEDVKGIANFKRMTKELRVIYLTCCMAAIVQGWDQASINGANQNWPRALKLSVDDPLIEPDGTRIDRQLGDVWLFGFINASPYMFASLIGAWLSDPLNEFLLGRRATIFVAAVFCLVSVLGSACVKDIWQLLVCRILLGIGMGCKAAVVPIFAAETAPAHIRGSLVMNWQLFVAFGIFLGCSMNLALFDIGDLSWRLQLAAAAIPALPLVVLVFVCPESPRFLIKKRAWMKAFDSLCLLNKTPVQAARELYLIHVQTELEKIKWYAKDDSETQLQMVFRTAKSSSGHYEGRETPPATLDLNVRVDTYMKRIVQLFSVARIRRATVAAIVVMLSQQLCGVNVLAFYSSTVVAPPGRDERQSDYREGLRNALWLSFGFGLANFLFAFPAFFTIDRWGRRILLIFTIPCLAVCLLAAAFCFQLPDRSSAEVGTVMLWVFLFAAFYSPGLGPVPFTYSAEVFPMINREAGMSLAVFVNLFGAGLLSLFVPFLATSMGPTGLFGLFAGLNLIAFVLVFVFVYETKKERLEKLDKIFDVKTGDHLQYQLHTVVPWFFRKLFRRDGHEEKIDTVAMWARRRETGRA